MCTGNSLTHRPVLLIAYTNHALDHILRAVHDRDITRNIVRLGSHSKDEVIGDYSLDKLDQMARTSYPPSKALSEAHFRMQNIEKVGIYPLCDLQLTSIRR